MTEQLSLFQQLCQFVSTGYLYTILSVESGTSGLHAFELIVWQVMQSLRDKRYRMSKLTSMAIGQSLALSPYMVFRSIYVQAFSIVGKSFTCFYFYLCHVVSGVFVAQSPVLGSCTLWCKLCSEDRMH